MDGSSRMSETERQRAVDKQLRRHGLILDDPVVLQAMEQTGEQGVRFLPIRITKAGAISRGQSGVRPASWGG